MNDDERLAECKRAEAAAHRREERDPTLVEIDEIRGRAIWALVKSGVQRDAAIATANAVVADKVGGRAWARYQSHRLRDHYRVSTRAANANRRLDPPADRNAARVEPGDTATARVDGDLVDHGTDHQ